MPDFKCTLCGKTVRCDCEISAMGDVMRTWRSRLNAAEKPMIETLD